MVNLTAIKINLAIAQLQTSYRRHYPNLPPEYLNELCAIAERILHRIARSNALYHNLDHTILVTLTGQTILQGKHLLEKNVTCEDWLHFIIALLCHDIGYVRGICVQDQIEQNLYTTATTAGLLHLPPGATDASLAPYHVDRGKRYVEETFQGHPFIDAAIIQSAIELTRFPVPLDEVYQDTSNYSGLVRAADLIGQLSDPEYLQKIPALFYEFQETGATNHLGFRHAGEMRAEVPAFYRSRVYSYIQDGLRYLKATVQGQEIIAQLSANVTEAERELVNCMASI